MRLPCWASWPQTSRARRSTGAKLKLALVVKAENVPVVFCLKDLRLP
jgi:hypothetical protein